MFDGVFSMGAGQEGHLGLDVQIFLQAEWNKGVDLADWDRFLWELAMHRVARRRCYASTHHMDSIIEIMFATNTSYIIIIETVKKSKYSIPYQDILQRRR